MAEKPEDKRYFPRAAIALGGRVTLEGVAVGFKVIDLTVEGISFQLDRELPADGEISITLDGNDAFGKHELKAEVIRCYPSKESTSGWMVAARFIDPDDVFLMDSLALVHSKMKNFPKEDL